MVTCADTRLCSQSVPRASVATACVFGSIAASSQHAAGNGRPRHGEPVRQHGAIDRPDDGHHDADRPGRADHHHRLRPSSCLRRPSPPQPAPPPSARRRRSSVPRATHVTVYRGQLGQILATIRYMESRGNYAIAPNRGNASGAYQFIQSTWDGYGGYSHAYLAPPSVQDEPAAVDVNRFLTQWHNDVSMIPVMWYFPRAATDPALMDVVPVPSAGNVLTIREYQQRWLAVFSSISGKPIPTPLTQGDVYARAGLPPTVPPLDLPGQVKVTFPRAGPEPSRRSRLRSPRRGGGRTLLGDRPWHRLRRQAPAGARRSRWRGHGDRRHTGHADRGDGHRRHRPQLHVLGVQRRQPRHERWRCASAPSPVVARQGRRVGEGRPDPRVHGRQRPTPARRARRRTDRPDHPTRA